MKVRHFAGYGSVEVKKVSKKTIIMNEYGDKKTEMVLSVKGNHEWGLVRNDIYDVRRWIFNKFEKNFNGQDYEINMTIKSDYIKEGSIDVEVATYTFMY